MVDKQIYQIGLTMTNGVGDILARHLLEVLGDVEAVSTEKRQSLEKISGIGDSIIAEIKRADVLLQAEEELAFTQKNGISIYFSKDMDCPGRLRKCPDTPVLFYFKEDADLNAAHIISVVGTRRASTYGQEVTECLLQDLSTIFPDLLIVSGLAYGINICAHRNALKNQLPAVDVLTHGLDHIYSPVHRSTAVKMSERGGLLTDFSSGMNPDRQSFIRRNRIVAGLAGATIVIESAGKGGSLITADIAFSYGRNVYAFPGRVTDINPKGYNGLTRQNKGGLIICADDLIMAARWGVAQETNALPIQTQLLFPEDEESERILSFSEMREESHINELSITLNLPVHQLSSLLFELELDGKMKSMPGSTYKRMKPLQIIKACLMTSPNQTLLTLNLMLL